MLWLQKLASFLAYCYSSQRYLQV